MAQFKIEECIENTDGIKTRRCNLLCLLYNQFRFKFGHQALSSKIKVLISANTMLSSK